MLGAPILTGSPATAGVSRVQCVSLCEALDGTMCRFGDGLEWSAGAISVVCWVRRAFVAAIEDLRLQRSSVRALPLNLLLFLLLGWHYCGGVPLGLWRRLRWIRCGCCYGLGCLFRAGGL